MGYYMQTAGSVTLPVDDEADAFAAVVTEVAAKDGWFPEEGDPEVTTLADLAGFVGAALTRDGDQLLFTTDDDGDPKWSDQATAFYVALAPYVRSGTVEFSGEDDEEWRYVYDDGSLTQVGINGWDGSTTPFGPPAEEPTREMSSLTPPVELGAPDAAPEPPGLRTSTIVVVVALALLTVLLVWLAT